jgi:hypothetical protein
MHNPSNAVCHGVLENEPRSLDCRRLINSAVGAMDNDFDAGHGSIEGFWIHDVAVYDLKWQPGDPGDVRRARNTRSHMGRAGAT